MNIPDSDDLRAIRKRAADTGTRFASQADRDRHDLLVLLDDLIEQANDGIFVEHECPAMFACAYIIAQTSAETSLGKEGGQ